METLASGMAAKGHTHNVEHKEQCDVLVGVTDGLLLRLRGVHGVAHDLAPQLNGRHLCGQGQGNIHNVAQKRSVGFFIPSFGFFEPTVLYFYLQGWRKKNVKLTHASERRDQKLKEPKLPFKTKPQHTHTGQSSHLLTPSPPSSYSW